MKHRHPGPKVRYHTRRNNIRFRRRPMHVQTLIFPKKKYNREKALNWAKEHGFKGYTSREEGNSIRVRQFPPSDVKRYGGIFPIGKDVKGVYAEVDKDRYKDKPYPYLKYRFNISSKGDDDKDKVPNYKDCRPWDKRKQDILTSEQQEILREVQNLSNEYQQILWDLGRTQRLLDDKKQELINALREFEFEFGYKYESVIPEVRALE